MFYSQNVRLAFCWYILSVLQFLSVVFRYFLLLDQLRAGDFFNWCTGQQAYEIYMYMSYRKERQKRHFFIWLKTEHDSRIWHQRIEEFGNSICTPVIQRQLTRQGTTYADINNGVTGILTVRKRLSLILMLFWMLFCTVYVKWHYFYSNRCVGKEKGSCKQYI